MLLILLLPLVGSHSQFPVLAMSVSGVLFLVSSESSGEQNLRDLSVALATGQLEIPKYN